MTPTAALSLTERDAGEPAVRATIDRMRYRAQHYGLTLSLATSGGATVEYSLRDDAGGAFSIDSATGVVELASGVDFEAGPVRTIIVQAATGQGAGRRTWARAFQVEVLDSPAPTFDITFPFSHARFSDAAALVALPRDV